ncbi:MAG: PLP-dependent aminotransferase family protein [Verrucomicrobiota bacterium]|jgi:2-aminoadipate transaminase
MNWSDRFAKCTALMKRSAVREVLRLTARPDMISFAGGLPAAELFPLDRVREASDAVLRNSGRQALQYGETEGLAPLRDWIASQFSRPQFQVQRENILITTGSQQALDLIGRVLLDEGDRVIVENPTYLALLSAWRPVGVQFLAASSDADGLRTDDLAPLLSQRPRLIYLTPNFQNPQGTTLTESRRKALIALAREHSVPIVEDNPYGELRYSGTALPNLLEIDAAANADPELDSLVIYTGTFSKVLMPGLRVGWIIAARQLIDKLVQAKQGADLHTSTLCQHLALQMLNDRVLDDFLPVLRRNYGERRDVMLDSLEKHFPKGATWFRPDGGMFLLASLPDSVNTAELLPEALRRNVAFVPGEEFHLYGRGKNTMRLNFSSAPPDRIEIGIERLGDLLRAFA